MVDSSTVFPNISSNTTTATTTIHISNSPPYHIIKSYRITLVIIYTLVLVMGSIGLPLMIHMVKSSLHSWTNVAFLNLTVVHLLFLLTTPFRIYYYAIDRWHLSASFCRLVSAMIHVHMYVVFVIYVIILSLNFLQYYKKMEMEFYRRFHALAASVAIWSILIIALPIVLNKYYGTNHQDDDIQCFHFGDEVKGVVLVLNAVLSIMTILVSCLLGCILGVILYKIIKKYGQARVDQHEFWAHMKNVSLVVIIGICLVPYHVFRLYYIWNYSDKLQHVNEVFLALTTVTCFDMLFVFAGKGICQKCRI